MAKIVTDEILTELIKKLRDTFVIRNDPSMKELSEKDRNVLNALPEDIMTQIADIKTRLAALEQKAATTTTQGGATK